MRDHPLTPTDRQLEGIRSSVRADHRKRYTDPPEVNEDTHSFLRELLRSESDGRVEAAQKIVKQLPEPETDSVRDYRALARSADLVLEQAEIENDPELEVVVGTIRRLASAAYTDAVEDVRERLEHHEDRQLKPGMVHVEIRDPVTKKRGGFAVGDSDDVDERIDSRLETYARGLVTCHDRLFPMSL